LFAVMQFSWGGKRPVISPTRKKAWKASRYIALISTFTKFDLHVYCSEPKETFTFHTIYIYQLA
jgi:hypothetical protein